MKTLLDLDENACHWPMGDPKTPEFRYCGEPASDRPYCPYHRRFAYEPKAGAPYVWPTKFRGETSRGGFHSVTVPGETPALDCVEAFDAGDVV